MFLILFRSRGGVRIEHPAVAVIADDQGPYLPVAAAVRFDLARGHDHEGGRKGIGHGGRRVGGPGRQVPGSRKPGPRVEDVRPLDLGPGPAEGPASEPEGRRGFRAGPSPSDADRPALPAPAGGVAQRDRRARPAVDERVLDAPVGQDLDGSIEGVALADAPQVQIERRGPSPLGSCAPDLEPDLCPGKLERSRPGPASVFYQSPDVDIKGARRIPPDLPGQGQTLICLDPDRQELPRLEAVEPGNLARRVEPVEKPFDAPDLGKSGPSGLAGVVRFASVDERPRRRSPWRGG